MYFNSAFSAAGIPPRQVYIDLGRNDCEITFTEGDTSNPTTHGSCTVAHGDEITWTMGTGVEYIYDFTYEFDNSIMAISSEDAFARYFDESTNSFLWVSCFD